MKITAVIPVRLESTRLPRKALADLEGKTLIRRVWERVKTASFLNDILIATDSAEIAEEVSSFGGKAVMTSAGHRSGTDRIAEVAALLHSDIIVNVQGDEPFVMPDMLETLVQPFSEDNSVVMATLKTKIRNETELNNPNVVKVVTDIKGNALYFSRSPVPFVRGGGAGTKHYKHIGLYAYRRDFLIEYSSMEPTPLECSESLEQLRALENGFSIRVSETQHDSLGIDTQEQLEKARKIIREGIL